MNKICSFLEKIEGLLMGHHGFKPNCFCIPMGLAHYQPLKFIPSIGQLKFIHRLFIPSIGQLKFFNSCVMCSVVLTSFKWGWS